MDLAFIDNLKNSISDTYAKGKLNKEQYDKLDNEISEKYKELLDNEFVSLDNKSESDKEIELNKIKKDIDNSYDKGRINSEQFANLKKQISIRFAEILHKEIDPIKTNDDDIKERIKKIEDSVTDAYSKDKINEIHYDLVQKKLSKYEKQ